MKYRAVVLGLCLAVSVPLLSCSGRAEAALTGSGGADITLDFALAPRTAALIRSFSAVLGNGAEPVIDGPAVAESISRAPGVTRAVLLNQDAASLSGTITVARLDQFLALPLDAASAPFITWDGAGFLSISLNRETAPTLLPLFSVEITEYLSALMAPCASGEIISRRDYLALVASVYGQPVAGEIAAATVRLVVTAPGPVTAIRGGRAEGRAARFEIPLLDMLVLDVPLEYHLRWN
ncbi:MAG: hypothetical protein LBC88_08040 [Spirochaetaceae bacterium]|jgi:hypothetical protein|nr:hypothetical protein [Spirochaetaceae bacterium]